MAKIVYAVSNVAVIGTHVSGNVRILRISVVVEAVFKGSHRRLQAVARLSHPSKNFFCDLSLLQIAA